MGALVIVLVTAGGAFAYSYAKSDPVGDVHVNGSGVTAYEKYSADITKVTTYSDTTYLNIKVYVRNLYPREGQELQINVENLLNGVYSSQGVKVYARYYTDGSSVVSYYDYITGYERKYTDARLSRSDSGNYTLVRIPRTRAKYTPDRTFVATTVYHTGGSAHDSFSHKY
ncbi:hypothetical protein ASE01_15830 [Nocardioides sp. Root190]|nr:hypothetical protein ASE01_15830 [Nocardioides sp. Root190]